MERDHRACAARSGVRPVTASVVRECEILARAEGACGGPDQGPDAPEMGHSGSNWVNCRHRERQFCPFPRQLPQFAARLPPFVGLVGRFFLSGCLNPAPRRGTYLTPRARIMIMHLEQEAFSNHDAVAGAVL